MQRAERKCQVFSINYKFNKSEPDIWWWSYVYWAFDVFSLCFAADGDSITDELLKEQKQTVQGRLKELSQKELLYKMHESECEQEIEEKALEYELQITDAQVFERCSGWQLFGNVARSWL